MSGVAHTDYRRVMDAADANGWEPEDESGTVSLSLRLTRGEEWVRVLFDSHGTAELASTSGPPGTPRFHGHQIDVHGPRGVANVIEVLTRKPGGERAAHRSELR
jgi:hypothetical protein